MVEQSSSTKEISGSVAQSSIGIAEINRNMTKNFVVAEDISKNILKANRSAGSMADRSMEVNKNIKEPTRLANQLNDMVVRFSAI